MALVAVLTAACTGQAPASTVLSPKGLGTILSQLSEENNQANQTLSVAAQNRDEQASAAVIDDGAFTLARRAGYKTLTGPRYYAFGYALIKGSVPRQTTYPAVALAIAASRASGGTPASQASCPGSANVLVLRKDSGTAPWRVELEPEANASGLSALASAAGGFGELVTSSVGLASPLDTLESRLSGALARYAATGTRAAELPASVFGTKTQCWGIDNLRADVLADAHVMLALSVSVKPYSPGDLMAFRLSSGGALAIFSLSITLRTTAVGKAGQVLVTPTASIPASFVVPAGAYSSISVPEVIEVAVVDPPASKAPTGSFQIVGSYGDDLPGSGTLASPGSSGPPATGPQVVAYKVPQAW